MQTKFIATGVALGALALMAPLARAATVTHLVEKGTTANLSLTVSLPTATAGCTIDVFLVLAAASTVERSNGTSSLGASGFLQRTDNCAGTVEFGSFDQPLTSGFSTTAHAASLTTTIPVVMESFSAGGQVTRSLAIALQFQDTPGDTIASMSHSRISTLTTKLISNGQSVFRLATMAGQLSLDGVSLINAGENAQSSLETSKSVSIDITR